MARVDQFKDWYKAYRGSSSWQLAGSEEDQAEWNEYIKNTGGWCSAGTLRLLNYAVSHCLLDDEQYLEIGTYCGRSLCGALRNNDVLAQVIDPFDLFLPDGKRIREAWEIAINRFDVHDRVTLHRAFAEQFDGDLPKIGVYYYDGSHEVSDSYKNLVLFERFLADEAIVIVDDVAMPEVAPDIVKYVEQRDYIELLAETPFGPHHQSVMIYRKPE